MTTQPERGWYADPTSPARIRWWDGNGWTGHTAPAPPELTQPRTQPERQPQPAQPHPQPPPQPQQASEPQAPAPPPPPPPPPSPPPPPPPQPDTHFFPRHEAQQGGPGAHWALPIGRSGLAIAAGYLGLAALLLLPAPLAVFVGVLALRDLRANPDKKGKGRAMFGIVTGALGTIALLAIIAASVL